MVRHYGSGLLLIAALTAGCAQAPSDSGEEAVAVVATSPLRVPLVEWDEYVGRITPIEAVDVRARVSGHLASTHFEEGQIVKEGDLLCILDQRPFQIAVNQAEADMAGMRARLQEAQALLIQTEAEVRSSETQRNLAQQMLNRVKGLVPQSAISKEEIEIRESKLKQSVADLDVRTARVASAHSAVATAEASLRGAESHLASAKLNLDYTEIRAPITGRVGNRAVTDGNLISGGNEQSTLLTTIVSLNPIHVYFDADEQSYLKYMHLAETGKLASYRDAKLPAFVRLGNEHNFPHQGHLDFFDNRLDKATATMRGRAILPNPDLKLTPGLFAKVRIPGSGRTDAVLVPDSAIATDQSEKYVYVIDAGQLVQRQKVEIGRRARGLRIVAKGLNGQEQIVLRGLQRVRPGTAVASTFEATQPVEEGLPDTAEPVPESQQLKSYVKRRATSLVDPARQIPAVIQGNIALPAAVLGLQPLNSAAEVLP